MDAFDRIGLVVHPRRELRRALDVVREWAEHQGAEVVQLAVEGAERVVAPEGDPAECDLVMALGGDGTTLVALHTAAPLGRPVLGVACGSLGALTAVTADDLEDALDRISRGQWEPRRIPAMVAARDGAEPLMAVNDLVLVRAGAGQVIVELTIDGQRYVRFAGDGLVASTPLGSTAYTLAAGGPMIAPGAEGVALTPLAPHGGVCPPVVAATASRVEVLLEPGNGGARVEADGQVRAVLERLQEATFSLSVQPDFATLVSVGEEEPLVAGLRRRRIIVDSPRVLARDDREAAARATAAPG